MLRGHTSSSIKRGQLMCCCYEGITVASDSAHSANSRHVGTFENCPCLTRKITFACMICSGACTEPSQAYALSTAKPKALSSDRRNFRRIYERSGLS
ncbi:hypothetical protein EUGRSUZ_H03386 [Eucalyptus grandis]|uniref:Uncharacterized protein n=2 Tax=Eucalyptus grandis TaxID=71139 RepID=A0ACC3JXP8_EUCGR|nr:hypothetical protein EUGRSUZ_H03386 [Eucalyptus grandis]